MPFYEVEYKDKRDEVDFFRSMGRPTMDTVVKLWYTDESGNISSCASQVLGDMERWRNDYWDTFYRDACFKTKDWEYEREYRLLLNPGLEGSYSPCYRTLTYDFNSLKGIVFGIRTSDGHKLEIIDIITRKCLENDRTNFQFSQVYYSPETGDFRSHKI